LRAAGESRAVDLERVGGDDLEAAREGVGQVLERLHTAMVALDRDHAAGALEEQRPRQTPGAGPNLDHGNAFETARRARDAAGEVHIEKEVLAQRTPGRKPVLGDDLA
jgi:hypothetical protein